MNVNKEISKEYEKKDTWLSGKNEPKTNPNEPKFKKVEMNVTVFYTKRYENISNWAICENEPKTNPKQTQFQTGYLLVKRMIYNYLPVELFPLTSCPAGRYNGIFSKISFSQRQLKGYGNE